MHHYYNDFSFKGNEQLLLRLFVVYRVSRASSLPTTSILSRRSLQTHKQTQLSVQSAFPPFVLNSASHNALRSIDVHRLRRQGEHVAGVLRLPWKL